MGELTVLTKRMLGPYVEAGEIATAAVLSSHIGDLEVSSGKLATGAVTTVKITDLNVTSGKIATAAVVDAHVATGAILGPKIDASGAAFPVGAPVASGDAARKSTVDELFDYVGLQYDIIPLLAFSNVNWSSVGFTNTYFLNIERWSSAAINSEVVWKRYLSAGTYTISIVYVKGDDRGIYSIQIDDVEVGTVDSYAASVTINQVSSITGINVATSGLKSIKLKMASKNANSTAYYGNLNFLGILRTA